MQIVIPMSGFGERFRIAGYKVPKPLINIDGKPIIAHVLNLFPGESNFIFVCNQEHLDDPEYRMEQILRSLCPTGLVLGIPPHSLGPVHAVRQVEHQLDPTSPVVVNYCDFSCYWDWNHFRRFVEEVACVGAIPAYRGFHPHSLGSTNYAYMREANGWVQDIQEKKPYTSNRMQEFASTGTYYFSSAQIMSQAFRVAIEQKLHLGGEYYVSLAYKPLLAEGKPVAVYPLQHFMQWGTPEDVAEYRSWCRAFRSLVEKPGSGASVRPQGSVILPMAGFGRRFVEADYSVAKPMISVSGKPMVVQAIQALPPAEHYVFVLRKDMPGTRAITDELRRLYPQAIVEILSQVTEGQACTALLGLDALERAVGRSVPEPVTFGACDHGALYDGVAFQQLVDDDNVDVIVWGVRDHANALRHPQMFGWIKANHGWIERISVKTPLDSPASAPIVSGTFTFRHADDFRHCVGRLIKRNDRINGEFYLDSCINDAVELGLRCRLFDLDSYLSWGTPDDLRTFEYWQSCFHKWPGHPYRLENDQRVAVEALEDLGKTYCTVVPKPVKLT